MVIDLKTCARCRISKESNNFHRDSRRLDGLKPYCKSCRKSECDPEKDRSRKRAWYEKNRLIAIESARARVIADPSRRKAWWDGYYEKNSDKVKADVVKWQKSHPHIIAWRRLLNTMLRKFGRAKSGRTVSLLGYTADELRSHIESLWSPGMSWDNHGEWHIDHIRPLSSFPLDEDTRIVNSLANLQPLWATTRVVDGVVYEGNLNKNGRWV